MATRVSISKCKVRGESFWRVRWHDAGKVHRKFFTSRDAAESHASTVRGDAVGVRQLLAAIPQPEQEKLVMLYNEAQRRGADLLMFLQTPQTPRTVAPMLGNVIAEMGAAKSKAQRDNDYLKSLRQILTAFAKGRERMPVDKLTHVEVEAFLESKPLKSRPTLRSRLSTLFKFAVRRGYRPDNPCDRLESLTVTAGPVAVMTLKEVEKCLGWLKANPRSLAWFVLSTFAGLRPEEAEKTRWKEIHFKEGWIRVEAQTTKVRQRRVVYPKPMAIEWLKRAKRLKSTLPLTVKTRTRDRKILRAVLGWKSWKQDVTRHTCASMWLADCGSAADVATALGHSESVLRKHYMALVTKTDAAKFWSL